MADSMARVRVRVGEPRATVNSVQASWEPVEGVSHYEVWLRSLADSFPLVAH